MTVTIPEPVRELTTESQLTRDLINARELLEQGWCQRSAFMLIDDSPHFCLSGALYVAVLGYAPALGVPARRQTLDEESRIIKAYQFVSRMLNGPPIESWNDNPRRTQREVLTLVDEAIENSRERESVGTLP